MTYLSHKASFHSRENITPSKHGTKHLAWGLTALDARADSVMPSLHEQVVMLPGASGAALEVTLLKPEGDGPFPLAFVNGGANHISAAHHGERDEYNYLVGYFLSRGYAVAEPMARGLSHSAGNVIFHGCALQQIAMENGQDFSAILKGLLASGDYDPHRVVITGLSFGGMNTLGMSALGENLARAQIVFYPTIRTSDCASQDDYMPVAAHFLGMNVSVPTLWVAGHSDSLLPDTTWKRMFDAYHAGNPNTTLLDVGKPPFDSHHLLTHLEGLPLWTGRVDQFLSGLGLPSRMVQMGYLPSAPLPSTKFARIDDVNALPGLTAQGREMYRDFLTRPFPRAFVLAPGRAATASWSGADPLGNALAKCRKSGVDCYPYAINDKVVWTRGRDTGQKFTFVMHTGQTMSMFLVSLNPDCSVRGIPTLRVDGEAPHGFVSISRPATGHSSFPSGSPFMKCNTLKSQGTLLTYKVMPGFFGSDHFVFVRQDAPGDSPQNMTFTIRAF